MRWMRLTLMALLLSLAGACANPAGPRYPQEKDGGEPPPEGEQQGFVILEQETFWV